MKTRYFFFMGIVLMLGFAGFIAAVFFLPPVSENALLIEDSNGKILATLPVRDGRFDYVFIHSIHRTKVEERFTIEKNGNLHLFGLRYQNSGVGMPADAEGGYRLEDGHFILTMDRTFKTIPLFVSIVPGHGISIDGKFFPFTTWAKPEDALVLAAKTRFF